MESVASLASSLSAVLEENNHTQLLLHCTISVSIYMGVPLNNCMFSLLS